MYTSKAVRPRSSLSIDDHQRKAERKQRRDRDAFLTVVGCCIFLLILVAFLLTVLVLVGKSIATEQDEQAQQLAQKQKIINNSIEEIDFKPVGTWPTQTFSNSRAQTTTTTEDVPFLEDFTEMPNTLTPTLKSTSKILNQLGFRLPRELLPRKYQLRLEPDLHRKTFTGQVLINFDVTAPISFVPVHSKLLNVSTQEVLYHNANGTTLPIVPAMSFSSDEHEYWVTEFAQPLAAGNYTLNLNFNGSLTNRIVGFYQSSYYEKSSKQTRWIATSKFEPTYARQAFPCFDEPHMKAKFSITVVRPSGDGYHALSNMNVEQEDVEGNVTAVTFAQSVPMSTYLVCFIVSDFAHKSGFVHGTLPLRVFATPAQINKVDYALETAIAITEFYIEYFDITYPLPKLDLAAIPDFVSGAMEHWGLVTFRETALLYEKATSASNNKLRVANVIAHELAHMWFGNLVTMKWWNDLWLNEGFATYIQYKGVDRVHPEWQILHHFVVDDLHAVMRLDATLASHPIVQRVDSPDQITELFDSITYSKGASIIRMLEDLVKPEIFRKGTTAYLKEKMFGNAETIDFLNAIGQYTTSFDVTLFMRTWTEQMGLPVIDVTREDNTLKLKQKRFLANADDYDKQPSDSKFNYRWMIPITYFTNADAGVASIMFNYDQDELTVTLAEDITWIKFNKDQKGYYRVNYPDEMWHDLTKALISSRTAFSQSDRAHLINDAFSLADAGQLNYSVALDFSIYLENELDYVPWSEATSCLQRLNNRLYHTDIYVQFTSYARKLLNAAIKFAGIESTSEELQINLLRSKVLGSACQVGDKTVLSAAGERFKTWLQNTDERPSPDLRSFVYYYGMQEIGNETNWDTVWQLYLAEQDAQEKIKLMQALAAIKDPWLLQRFINLAWKEENVRGQDYFTCLINIAQNRIGENIVWDYVRENWPKLAERFGLNDRYLGRLISSITARFATVTKLEELNSFYAKYPDAGAGAAARKQALEHIKQNIKWLQLNKESVAVWLATRHSNNES